MRDGSHGEVRARVEELGAGKVHFHVDGHVGWITLDNPRVRNAMDTQMASAVADAVEHIETHDDLWVGVLTGTGPVFCAGANLNEVSADGGAGLVIGDGGFCGFVRRELTRPWIASLNGHALAGGCELALACDLIVGAEGIELGLLEVARGLTAGAGGIFRLPRVLPRNLAIELLITARRIPVERAAAYGMVNSVVPLDDLAAATAELAAAICANAPIAVRVTLDLARDAAQLTDEEAWVRSQKGGERNRETADFSEGPRAFLEKRAPNWAGR